MTPAVFAGSPIRRERLAPRSAFIRGHALFVPHATKQGLRAAAEPEVPRAAIGAAIGRCFRFETSLYRRIKPVMCVRASGNLLGVSRYLSLEPAFGARPG